MSKCLQKYTYSKHLPTYVTPDCLYHFSRRKILQSRIECMFFVMLCFTQSVVSASHLSMLQRKMLHTEISLLEHMEKVLIYATRTDRMAFP